MFRLPYLLKSVNTSYVKNTHSTIFFINTKQSINKEHYNICLPLKQNNYIKELLIIQHYHHKPTTICIGQRESTRKLTNPQTIDYYHSSSILIEN